MKIVVEETWLARQSPGSGYKTTLHGKTLYAYQIIKTQQQCKRRRWYTYVSAAAIANVMRALEKMIKITATWSRFDLMG